MCWQHHSKQERRAHHVDSVEGIRNSIYECCMEPPEYLQHNTKHMQISASIILAAGHM